MIYNTCYNGMLIQNRTENIAQRTSRMRGVQCNQFMYILVIYILHM